MRHWVITDSWSFSRPCHRNRLEAAAANVQSGADVLFSARVKPLKSAVCIQDLYIRNVADYGNGRSKEVRFTRNTATNSKKSTGPGWQMP